MNNESNIQEKAINTIRFLSADAVQNANSGHPGLPMGTAAIAYTLWTKHLRHNPANPDWIDRDRFILSGGHGSMLLYSLLHLTGYNISLEDIKNFRQWESITPGHPEYGITPGVETTTGPLGQGFANGVGMAIAEAHLSDTFNRTDFNIIDHYTYGIVTDGDLMEGVASEAASLAGHLRLGKLIYFYDDNRISIDGSTDITFTEDRSKRFEAYGWQIINVNNGNEISQIDKAIKAAKNDPRPSLIVCKTHIGYGLPTRQDTAKAHGEPPGEEEIRNAKINLGWPKDETFYIPDDVKLHFKNLIEKGIETENSWQQKFNSYMELFPKLANELTRRIENKLPENWEKNLPQFPPDEKGIASRAASGKVINSIAHAVPELIGGSADLTPSNKTWIDNSTAINPENFSGRNIHFGVREHAMGAIINGISYHKGLIPYGATFLVFSDYMRPAIRISALSNLNSIWVFTHDSIGLGEDGPTHQPVEHLAALRSIPNLVVMRPADANEVSESWRIALERNNGPTLLALSRQNLPTIDRNIYASSENVSKGAYVLKDFGQQKADVILMASGSEVSLIVEAASILENEGINVRVVSFPSWELFNLQDQSYKDSVLDPEIPIRIAVEAGISQGWEKWIGCKGTTISLDHFGASAPAKILFEKFGFTTNNIIDKVKSLLNNK